LFSEILSMLAKLTAKNQLTVPKAAMDAVGATEYFEVAVRDGVIVLTPVRIQRGDAVRAKLAELAISESDVAAAVDWVRSRAAEPRPGYAVKRPSHKQSRKPGKRGT